MHRILGIIACILLLSCSSEKKSDNGNEEKQASYEKTKVSFKKETHNFGELTAGEIVVFGFEFTNSGQHPFQIDKVVSDCGCIKSHYRIEPVKPGESGVIEVEFDSSGLHGREYKSIEVHGNSKELKHLAIFAVVKNELIDFKY